MSKKSNLELVAHIFLPKDFNSYELIVRNPHPRRDHEELIFYNKKSKCVVRMANDEGDELIAIQTFECIDPKPNSFFIEPFLEHDEHTFKIDLENNDDYVDMDAYVFFHMIEKKIGKNTFDINIDDDDYNIRYIRFNDPAYTMMFQLYFADYIEF